jgi:hypothetical protein
MAAADTSTPPHAARPEPTMDPTPSPARPIPARRALSLVAAVPLALLGTSAARAQSGAGHDHDHGHGVVAPARPSLGEAAAALRSARASLPPPPAGVTHVDLAELFAPIGDRGLAYSEKLRALDGRPVRLLGFMVRQDRPAPGLLLLAPFPFQLHESEYGLAEDLPAALVHVIVPERKDEIVPYTPGLLLLTGDLSLGPREEPDGRISSVRLALHPRTAEASHPASHKEKSP